MIFILFFHSFKLYSLHLFNNSSFAVPFERNFHRNFFPIKSIKNFARREKEKKTKGNEWKRERKTELTLSVLTRARRGEGQHARDGGAGDRDSRASGKRIRNETKGRRRRCEKDGAFYTQALFMRTGRRPRIRV